MIELLPAIHRLLVLDSALLNENVNDAGVGDIAILFEVLADAMADVGGRNVEGIEGDDFRRLREDIGIPGEHVEHTKRACTA